MQTECLIEPQGPANLEIVVRFLQVQPRDGDASWEDGAERTVTIHEESLQDLANAPRTVPFEIFGDARLFGVVCLRAEPIDGFIKLQVRVENHTPFPNAAAAERSDAMRLSFVGTHTLLGVSQGAFVSLIDPPPAARGAANCCSNLRTWPVLVGEAGARDTLLSAPIILEDYPAIAPESQAEFCDGTEIDEILALRVLTLTDQEKSEACASDERARRIIEHCDQMAPASFERLHGAIRSMTPTDTENFFNPPDETPEGASVAIAGGEASRGARVRLAPKRQADSMDLFLDGRTAVVAAVHHDVDNRVYVAVTVEDDPAADIQGRVGRYFYFYPDELELIGKET
jgi:hypothetical protein